MASVLRSHQLLEMRIGETEVRYSESGDADVFGEIKSLIFGCLHENPDQRLDYKAALRHKFLIRDDLRPQESDLDLLPTKVIMIMEGIGDDKADASQYRESGQEN